MRLNDYSGDDPEPPMDTVERVSWAVALALALIVALVSMAHI